MIVILAKHRPASYRSLVRCPQGCPPWPGSASRGTGPGGRGPRGGAGSHPRGGRGSSLDDRFVSPPPVPIVTGQGLTAQGLVKDLRNGHLESGAPRTESAARGGRVFDRRDYACPGGLSDNPVRSPDRRRGGRCAR